MYSLEILLILDAEGELGNDMIDICKVLRKGDDREFESERSTSAH